MKRTKKPNVADVFSEDKAARGERLKRLRGMANLSRNRIADEYGISADTQKNWELGRHAGLTERGATRILEALKKGGIQCSLGWLLNGTGAPPIILSEQDKALGLSEQRKPYAVLPISVQIFCEQHPNAVYMRVEDDGMEPNYFKGDYVAGERYYQGNIQKTIGKYCIVETQMGQTLLRRIRQGDQEGLYSLQCINVITSYLPLIYNVELVSAAPVILHWRMG
jgi:transcriptional regulator with XRE-family HTH domain